MNVLICCGKLMPEQTKQYIGCTLPICSIHMWTTGHLVKTSVRHLKQIFNIKTSGFIRFTQRNSLPKIPSCMVAVHIWPHYMQSGLPVQTWVEKWEYFALKKINSLDILVRRNHNCQNKTPLQLQWPITGMLLKILFLHLGQKNFGWKTFHVNSSSCRGACLWLQLSGSLLSAACK